jgi:hypothetical protein
LGCILAHTEDGRQQEEQSKKIDFHHSTANKINESGMM